MSTAERASPEQGMTLVEHLTELRTRVIISVVAVAIGVLAGFILYPQIFDVLIKPYKDIADNHPTIGGGRLLQTDPLEGFSIRMRTSLYAGIAFAMPAVPFVVSALVLFVLGATLAYFTLPRAFDFLIDIGGEGFVTGYTAGKYFKLVTYMMLAFGVGFEFPIVLIFFQMAGIVETDTLRRARRFAIVGICILVAVITPSGDPISMLMLSVPMVIFYELAILIGSFIGKRQARREAA
jgi:sec-independent protein translocase protein TatC